MTRCISLAMLAAVAVGCAPGERRDAVVEKVPLPSLEVMSPAELAMPTGAARTWDFSGGAMPSGGKIRKGSVPEQDGMRSLSPTNMALGAGYQLDSLWTPSGAFLFEADITFGDMCAQSASPTDGIVWDDMAIIYVPRQTHRGFQLQMQIRNGNCTPILHMGFTNSTETVRGPALMVQPGLTEKIAFLFGANGRIVWDFGGKRLECTTEAASSLAPSVAWKATIGDRAVSNYHPFPGTIRRVSITPCATDFLKVALKEGRKAFVRGETNAAVTVMVANALGVPLRDVRIETEQFAESGRIGREGMTHGDLAAGAEVSMVCRIETRIGTGWHPFRVTVTGRDADGKAVNVWRIFKIGIGPRPDDRMTALMWGYEASSASTLADYGFTHGLKYMRPCDRNAAAVYDDATVAGVGVLHSMWVEYPGGKPDRKYLRHDRDGNGLTRGKSKDPIPEVSNPAFLETIRPIVAQDAEMYKDYPGFAGVLPISEMRDATAPSFNTEHVRYRNETGRDVPAEVNGKTLDWRKGFEDMKLRYKDGVVPVDDPVLAYYRWFWKGGDGWPAYSGGIADEYRRHVSRKNFFTFWDPAVRCPPTWGSGGTVDMLNQWVYSVPEPMNVAGPAEEILAMAAGSKGQKPAIMTQLICYRSQIAPMNKKVSPEPDWVRRRPLADFPSIPPDSLQEATWSMIAKPVQAIMYHGWGTIAETGRDKGYVFTNPESSNRLERILKETVAPLGPTLKRLGRKASPVAVLESFTTCVLGGPASWGWKAPSIMFMQRARLDPRVVYEDTILRDGLDDVKVLYAPQCVFLTKPVVDRIREFQRRGGTLVADEQLMSALKADVTVPLISFEPPPESDHTEEVDAMEAAREGDAKTRRGTMRARATMLRQAETLRRDIASRYVPEADSSSPEIVVYSRSWNDVRYLFAINDHRTFGDYVGPWGLTMEKGLPFAGSVTLADNGATAAVYELSRGGEVKFTRADGRISVPVRYDTNDGRIFAFLKERIASVKVDAPSKVRPGDTLRVKFSVLDGKGRPVDALLPGEIRLFDAAGRELDGAGWTCLQGGTCTIDILTNVDDAYGDYRLVCRDRASGLSVERTIRSK